eukprot:GHVS01097334.1.p1 GENE.GHVS01097334.1~~GHVS01097334.1.p1  ORF type:complete len:574 (-),score=85.55 GHVS01097334.1:244-1965(-)
MSSGCCDCCDVVEETEEAVWLRRRREEMKESLRSIKGLSRQLHCDRDVEAVVDRIAIEHPQLAVIPSGACSCGMRTGARHCSISLLLWLLLYGVVMISLQLQLHKLITNQELEQLADRYLQDQDVSRYFRSFHWFFSFSTGVTMIVMTIAFVVGRIFLGLQIYTLSSEVVGEVKEEYQSELVESINTDFYEYVQRLTKYVVVSDDFTKAEMKKIHRKLNLALTEGGHLLCYPSRDKCSIRNAIEQKVVNRRNWITAIFFFIPCVINVIANCTLIYYVFDLRFRHNHSINVSDYVTVGEHPQAALQSEGFRLIAAALTLNFISWIYLTTIMSGSIVYCMLKCMYCRIHTASVAFTNRMMNRIWQDVVVDGIAPFIEETRPSLLFIDPTDVHTVSPAATAPPTYNNSNKYSLLPPFNQYEYINGGMSTATAATSPVVTNHSNLPSPHRCHLLQQQQAPPTYGPPIYFASAPPAAAPAPPNAIPANNMTTDWDERNAGNRSAVSVPAHQSSPPNTRVSTAVPDEEENSQKDKHSASSYSFAEPPPPSTSSSTAPPLQASIEMTKPHADATTELSSL